MLNLDELKYFIRNYIYLSRIKISEKIQDDCQLVGVQLAAVGKGLRI